MKMIFRKYILKDKTKYTGIALRSYRKAKSIYSRPTLESHKLGNDGKG